MKRAQPVYWTGIGSRETPASVLNDMEQYAIELARAGLVLRSGGAQGADTAFYNGYRYAREQLLYPCEAEIYVPWASFALSVREDWKHIYRRNHTAVTWAKAVHPVYSALKQGVQLLHERNVHQVLGKDLSTKSAFVLFYAQETNGVVKGGTATAVHLARLVGVPTINMYHNPNWRQEVLAKVLS